MAKIITQVTVYFSKKTNNASFFNIYKNGYSKSFNSADNWFNFWMENPTKVKRFSGSQFENDNGRYTRKMAENDFKKFSETFEVNDGEPVFFFA